MSSLGTWPTAIRPRTARFMLQTNQRANASPGGGSEQVVDLLNDRLMCYLTLPVRKRDAAAAEEAFLASFRGQVNTVNLWHFARPQPRGTMRGSMVLTSAASAGTDSLQLQAQRGRVNLFTYSEQQDDAAWTKTNATVVPNAGTASTGTLTAERLVPNTVNGAHLTTRNFGTVAAGEIYTSTIEVRRDTGARYFRIAFSTATFGAASVYFDLDTGLSSNLSVGSVASSQDLGGGWYRIRLTATATAPGSSAVNFYSYQVIGAAFAGDDVSGPLISRAQCELDDEPSAYQRITTASDFDPADYTQADTTLLAGDVLGLGNQLLMLSADATSDASAVITVPLVNRVRAAQALGAAVTWDQPTAPFRLLSHSGVNFVPGYAEEVTLQLGEAIGL